MIDITSDTMLFISITLFSIACIMLATKTLFFDKEMFNGLDEDGEEIWLNPNY